MIDLLNLSPEQKSSAVLSVSAFLLSLVTGIVSGVNVSVVLIRSVLFALFFAAIGFCIVFILKKYVPEVYDAFQNRGEREGAEELIDAGLDDLEEKPALAAEGEPDGAAHTVDESGTQDQRGSGGSEKKETGFQELAKDDFNKYESHDESLEGPSPAAEATVSKMGKHIVVKEDKFASYEPKLMAEAVRTMLKREED